MATTALFVEILVIGIQANVWVVLAFVYLTGITPDFPSGWKDAVTVFALAESYTLGIVIDRIADSAYVAVFRPKEKDGKEKDRKVPFSTMRLRILKENEQLAGFLDYQRSRLRIARATVFNCVLVVIAVALGEAVHCLKGDLSAAGVAGPTAGVAAALLFPLALYAAGRINDAYEKRLAEAYAMYEAE